MCIDSKEASHLLRSSSNFNPIESYSLRMEISDEQKAAELKGGDQNLAPLPYAMDFLDVIFLNA